AEDALRVGARQEVLELHLDDRRVAPGFVELGLLDHHRVLPDHDHVAGANFLCSFHCMTCMRKLLKGLIRKTFNYTSSLAAATSTDARSGRRARRSDHEPA